ncbi:MAG: RNA-binding protein [Boseongicola sp. SB0662_bin_57]|nr:RNA-binding protein [Boseongicola sp. SB0662_bin_57]
MPTGPNGEKRPADVVGCAVKVMRIATGEIEDDRADKVPNRAKGGNARAAALSPRRKSEIGQAGAGARWAAQ